MGALELVGESRCFGGRQLRFAHRAASLDCDMHFAVYLPPQAESEPVPVLYWLSGLTCNDENFTTKAGAQRYASAHGVALVAPDTSPRGEGVPDDPEGAWDFGLGAGFYVNATNAPWSAHYRMYDYVLEDLPAALAGLPLDTSRAAISGHSMGGHGALVIALRNPGRFRSVSAFAPICSPTRCPWGEKALGNYLGDDRAAWESYDSTCLIRLAGEHLPMLVDQGEADGFLAEQLRPELLREAAQEAGYPLTLRMQPDYDHSYYFISTFIGEHIAFHASHL
ncbi:S-formylglutathione hydrolase [Mangrovimicrobium sediminis]|nr:S-formylglutathione hydrolase [Haliea sp. SAOS-164]